MSGEQDQVEMGDEKRVDLVLEGGGVKGIALAGAIAVLEERGFQPQRVAGTSAGAIAAAAVASGYTAAEIRDILQGMDFNAFKDKAWEDKLPFVDRFASILLDQGIYEGNYFLNFMAGILATKGKKTFGDLIYDENATELRYRHKAQVIVSDLTKRCLLALPQDAHKIGCEPDDLEVALAVRMSMSIPFFFEPLRFKNPKTGEEHILVDGGMLSNFPVWLFDAKDRIPRWPTFGLKLVEPDPKEVVSARISHLRPVTSGVHGVIDFIQNLVGTMTEAHDRLYLEGATYVRTIPIPTLGISGTDFGITKEDQDRLYQSGRDAAERFLDQWNEAGGFPAYVAGFRSGDRFSYRQAVLERMRAPGFAAPPEDIEGQPNVR